ncbi:MAG: FUSC family protein [Ginsengibacter sp.]
MLGYLISLTLHTGHSYWILLTIIVILKPAYSLTKQRNKDRLIGTLCGIFIGVIVLFFIKNNIALLILMIVFMTCCYIFLRTNYFISVMFMTPYLLLFFHLLYPADFEALLADRVIDTGIGSAIAFITSIFFIPKWERTSIKTYMIKMLEASSNYYLETAKAFVYEQPVDFNQLRIPRKNALVALANLSDAFNRMLSEPKRHQKGIENIHRFVVLSHTLTSHIATISYYLQTMKNVYRSPAFEPAIKDTIQYFTNAIAALEHKNIVPGTTTQKQSLRELNEQTEILMEKRRQELRQGFLETDTKKLLIQTKSVTDQFNYIYSIATDINKVGNAIEVD